jgi:hypothetical protein
MSASAQMKLAKSDVVRLRNHLRRAREYARVLGMDERVRLEVENLHHLEQTLNNLADQLGTAEARRRVETRRQGRAA